MLWSPRSSPGQNMSRWWRRVGTFMRGTVTITDLTLLLLLQRLLSVPRRSRQTHHPTPSLPHRLAGRPGPGPAFARRIWSTAATQCTFVLGHIASSICFRTQRRFRISESIFHDEFCQDAFRARKYSGHILCPKRPSRCTYARRKILSIQL